jgi:hypothetical protein
MEQIYNIFVKEKSLEISRHRRKENNKMFLERRMKGNGIIWFKETVSEGKNAIFKSQGLLNREKYFEQLTECLLLKKNSA